MRTSCSRLSALEQPHFDDLIPMWQVRSTGRFTEAIFDAGDRPAEWEILTRWARCAPDPRCRHRRRRLRRRVLRRPRGRKGVDVARATAGSPAAAAPPARLQIRTGPWATGTATCRRLTLQSFATRTRHRPWPMVPRIREILATRTAGSTSPRRRPGRRSPPRGAGRPGDRRLLLTSRRHLRSNNSWMHNVPVLVKGKDRCTLLIHPDDASAAASPTAVSRRSAPKPAPSRSRSRSATR